MQERCHIVDTIFIRWLHSPCGTFCQSFCDHHFTACCLSKVSWHCNSLPAALAAAAVMHHVSASLAAELLACSFCLVLTWYNVCVCKIFESKEKA